MVKNINQEELYRIFKESIIGEVSVPLETILEKIKEIKDFKPNIVHEEELKNYLDERKKAVDKLIDAYFVSSLSPKFPLLDENIINIKRHTLYKENKKANSKVLLYDTIEKIDWKGIDVESILYVFPFFVHFDLMSFIKSDKYLKLEKELEKITIQGHYHKHYKIEEKNVTTTKFYEEDWKCLAKFEEISDDWNLREKVIPALANYYAVCSNLFSNPILKDIPNLSDFHYPKFEIIFVPNEINFGYNTDSLSLSPEFWLLTMNARNREYIIEKVQYKTRQKAIKLHSVNEL